MSSMSTTRGSRRQSRYISLQVVLGQRLIEVADQLSQTSTQRPGWPTDVHAR